MINKALNFAINAHCGATRKGCDTPFILHPLEAASIVARMTDDIDLIIAALLHDTIEDTDVTYEDIKNEFGEKIARIVAGESEDKDKTWHERKSHTLQTLKNEPTEIKIVAMGDKLSNMRSMANDYEKIGDKLWERFNVKDKTMQGWYYKGLVECFEEIKNTREYKEYKKLVEQVFG
ncbi:MAG: bifunctional (p)ppGpp synthetase/guanosine-3',5'-bis(diphosphate) 3'-pyrophosphohydrolase [Alphaproteobacteria bacterium]|nr:bifunctional (p)ppGpp synthetase/guanosine-3',5'-bis(diphosphate) 3'-pyrophosphohydrolase [Alphaproteobacteria bacterium]